MSINLQQYLLSLMSTPAVNEFLDLRLTIMNNSVSIDLDFISFLARVFFLSDILLYVGCVVIILVLGSGYKRNTADKLSQKLANTSLIFVYLSLLINFFTLVLGADLLASCSITIFESSYVFNFYSQTFKLVILLLLAAFILLFPTVLGSRMRTVELPLLLQVCAALSVTAVSSNNFALLLLSLEGFSLTLYVFAALGRSYGGVTAVVKYFAFGTLGSVFLFWGVVHLYALVPSLSFEVINALLSASQFESQHLRSTLEFATTSIAFGFMLKLGAAPAHQWVADVYAGAHLYITAFFSIFVKFVLFIVFFRIASHFNADMLLNQFIVFSLIVGCFMSINQTEIKRLLAYSSIVHVAFLFMGDGAASVMYLLTYIISSLVIFSVLLNSQLAGKELVYLNDLRFLRGSSYFNLSCLTVALASSAGLPPFAGFYGKFLVWSSLVEDIYLTNNVTSYLILFLSIAVSLVTIYYYMRVIAYLFVGEDSHLKSASSVVVDNSRRQRGILYLQGGASILLVGWTIFQPYILPFFQFILLFA